MSRNGISFGAHTVSHPTLSRLPLEAARKEILDSKRHIEKELGKEVTTFSYPNGEPGDFNGDIEEILKSNGFRCAVTYTPAAFVSPTPQLYRLPRIGEPSFDKFELIMSGLYFDVVAKCSRLRR
jgi:peptidoglycan/xylan/chitin deacetylase (PgdA/CDA1 family)